jgi:hypothetical protein
MDMTRPYLYPHTRRIEVVMALYAAGFGLHAIYLKIQNGNAGLSWAGVENGWAVATPLLIVSLLHGLAIRINGRAGPLSPFLRAACMAAFAGFFFSLSTAGAGTSAAYTYSAITLGMAVGAINAAMDTVDAAKTWVAKWI